MVMKLFKIFNIILVAGIFFVSSGFAKNKDDNEKWVKVNEGNGIVSYGKLSSKDSVKRVYAVGIVDASVPVLEAVLRDVSAHKDYVHMVSKAHKVNLPGKISSKDFFYEYCCLGMPWPVWDRDAVGTAEFMIDETTGVLFVRIKGVKVDQYKPKKKAIRMPVTNLSFKLIPKGENKTEVTYLIEADPTITLPSFVLNMLFKTLGYNTIENLRDMVKMDKYKNVSSIITTTPWKK